jgi:hypothetical protein
MKMQTIEFVHYFFHCRHHKIAAKPDVQRCSGKAGSGEKRPLNENQGHHGRQNRDAPELFS